MDTSLAAADLGKDKGIITIRVGNNESAREVLDINKVLIPKKLAARIILLQDNDKSNQRPAFEDKRRVYGTFNYQPYKGTLLRGNFESGNTHSNRPITLLPQDNVTPWLNAGRPGYDWTFYDDPSKNPSAASQAAGPNTEGLLIGTNTVFGQIVAYDNPTDQKPTRAFAYTNLTTTTFAANSIASQIFNSIVNQDKATDTIRFVYTKGLFNLPAAYWTGANVLPGQQSGFLPVGIKAQSFSDYSVFDWRNHMIDETSRQSDSFHALNLALSQTAWKDRIGVEISYDRQRTDRHGKNAFFDFANSGYVQVDVNRYLPDGTINPNYGRPFVGATTLQFREFMQESDSLRATAYLKYDFKDLNRKWGKYLGRHTLTALYERDNSTLINYVRRLQSAGPAAEAADPGNIFSSNRRPSFVVYLGPSLIGNTDPLRLQAVQINQLKSGGPIPISHFVRNADQTDPGRFVTDSLTLADVAAGGGAQREVIKSKAMVLQSYWLDENLVTTASWRRDEDYFIRQNIGFVANPNDRNDPGKAFYNFSDYNFPSTPPPSVAKEIKSLGAVLYWPRKFIPLPKGMDVGIFYNKSENFTPIGGRLDTFGVPLAPPVGTTKEFGLNFSCLSGRLNLRVNTFDTAVQGVSAAPAFFAAFRNGTLALAVGWAKEGNTSPAMAAQSNADIETLFSALPSNFRQLYDFQVSGTPPNVAASANTVAIASTDTVDARAKGIEADITYNVTKNWRILLNVAKQETVQSNMFPFSKNFIKLMTPVWNQLKSRPAGVYPSGFQPGDVLPASVQTYGQYIDQNILVPFASAIAAEGSASAEQRKWRANLVTNYSFAADSKLKGIGLGGAVRWQDKLGIGYPSSRDSTGAAHFDIAHPYYAPAETNVDAWVSYSRPLQRKKILWKIQLNITNLIGSSDLIPVLAQSYDGTVAQYRLPPERRIYLTNTFTF